MLTRYQINEELPSEMIAHIFAFLDGKSFILMQMVCKYWKDILNTFQNEDKGLLLISRALEREIYCDGVYWPEDKFEELDIGINKKERDNKTADTSYEPWFFIEYKKRNDNSVYGDVIEEELQEGTFKYKLVKEVYSIFEPGIEAMSNSIGEAIGNAFDEAIDKADCTLS